MAKEERYRSWRAYKSRLQRDSRVSEEDVDALRKMRDVKYRGDIQEYVSRMKLLDRRVDVSLATLKELVRPGLSEPVLNVLPLLDKINTKSGFWKAVTTATRAHEDAQYAMKGHQKNTSSAPVNLKSDGNQSNNRDGAQSPSFKNSNRNQSHHVGTDQRRGTKESPITASKRDDNTRVSKPKREYPQVFPSYEKAQEGIPPAMIREQRDAGLCTRCGKKNHDVKFCAGRVNTTVAVAPL
jgi:hypothetical protein